MKVYLISAIIVLFLACVKMDTTEPQVNDPEPSGPQLKYAQSSNIVINEVCPLNGTSSTDEFNENPDWIELYNKGDSAINLAGYGLSDDSTDIFKWVFGNVTIEPKSFLMVYASGRDIDTFGQKPDDELVRFDFGFSWSDIDNVIPGHSTIEPYEYPDVISYSAADSGFIASATFNLVDNRPGLGWSSAQISMPFFRKKRELRRDYSMYNALEVKMTLEKDRSLTAKLTQVGLTEYKSFYQTLKGTGIKDDLYRIPLVQGKGGLDLTKLTGIMVQVENLFGKTSFTLKNVRFIFTGSNLHTNFKLSGNEGRLFITAPDSLVMDHVPISPIRPDWTYGNLDGKWVVLNKATPGTENSGASYLSITQAPKTVKTGGFYNGPVNVELDCDSSSQIHYTLDGSEPDIESPIYKEPITIDSTCVLRFAAVSGDNAMSDIKTETYFINETTKLPVVSISTDSSWLFDPDTGIYVSGPNADTAYPYFSANYWGDKEIPAHIEFFEANRNKGFSIEAGLCIMGNYSRAEDKKSLGIHVRNRYSNDKIDYPLFPEYPLLTKFKKFVLRNNGGNYGRAMIEDPMMQSLIDDRNIDHQKYRPVIVFVNGKYFGIHQLLEPASVDYLYTNYDLDRQQVEFFDRGGLIKQGTPDNWNRLISILQSGTGADCSKPLSDSVYGLVQREMDVYNFIDFMAFEIYINNTDWPANNQRWWRERSTEGRWRWFIYDTDAGFGGFGYIDGVETADFNTLAFATDGTKGVDEWPNGSGSTFLLRALLQNKSFKEDFVNRFLTLMATNFESKRVINRIQEMADEIAGEIPRDFKRWELKESKWQTEVSRLKSFAESRQSYVYGHIAQQFNFTGTYMLSLSSGGGRIFINDLPVYSNSFSGKYFSKVPLKLKVVPPGGMQFLKWSDGNTENPRVLSSDSDLTLTAIFK